MAKVKVYIIHSGDGPIDEFDTDDTHNGRELIELLEQRFGDGALSDPQGDPVGPHATRIMEAGVYEFQLCTEGANPIGAQGSGRTA